jgi:murein DD-endopeptidase MepM/ murein hydrolase activator NlpD
MPLNLTNSTAGTVRILPKPSPIYIEQRAAHQYLNFDFAIENLTDDTLQISSIAVSVFDTKGKLAQRKFVDSSGFSPSIQTIAEREIDSRQSLLVYNPFYAFDSEIELTTLHYTFTFVSKAQEQQFKAEVAVAPVFYETATRLTLPLHGRMIVYDGHDFYAHHRRFDYLNPIVREVTSSNFMRYAYDLCSVNEHGDMFKGDEQKNEDWNCFGATVYSTGSGKIVALFSDMPDNRSFNPAELSTRPMVLYGNYIVIDHLNGEFSLFGHLKQASITVSIGEMVTQDRAIAQVGASGSANIPHLHYELRTGMDMRAEGLPSYFSNYRLVLGSQVNDVTKGQIDTGDIVEM